MRRVGQSYSKGTWPSRCHLSLWVVYLLAAWIHVNGAKIPDGKEPWIIMFKKGVDGQQLFESLCPTVSIGDIPTLPAQQESTGVPSLEVKSPVTSVLNCTAHFNSLLNGLAGQFNQKQLNQIRAQYKNSIDYVISDKAVGIDSPETKWERPATRRLMSEQDNATWGLDMLDQGFLPLDHTFHYTNNGTGIHVYVLDTGIKTAHAQFRDPITKASRALHGYDAVYNSNSSGDCHGHGTHVSAIVGGNTYGVAKNATLHAVRVLDCDGRAMLSSLIKGLEWVAKNHVKPAVVHMSIEGGFSSLVNKAVEQLMKVQHVHVVVSSGNSGRDACRSSPASTPGAVTVAAIDNTLSRWAYSNWGACVDVYAPGVSILSAVSATDDSTALKTGTSMAAPFVTGVVAAYLEAHPGASPEEVQQKLYQSAVRGAVGDDTQGFATMFPGSKPDLLDISSTPNRLLTNNLTAQAHLTPGQLYIDSNSSMQEVVVTLTQQPSAFVAVDVTVPDAWDGNPIADVFPSQLLFEPDTWNISQTFALHPKLVCEGDYYITLHFRGEGDMFPAMHTVLVQDSRQRSGDTAAMARVISQLPFNDTGDTGAYTDSYGCLLTDASPDVVYRYTVPFDMDVGVSTCGSGFDTKLIVSTNLSDPSTYLCNDDDRGCASNTACSKLDVSFKANNTYYIVVDGYSGASGEYVLSVTCPKCTQSRPNSTTTPLIATLLQMQLAAAEAGGTGFSAAGSDSTGSGGTTSSNKALLATSDAALGEASSAGDTAGDTAAAGRHTMASMPTYVANVSGSGIGAGGSMLGRPHIPDRFEPEVNAAGVNKSIAGSSPEVTSAADGAPAAAPLLLAAPAAAPLLLAAPAAPEAPAAEVATTKPKASAPAALAATSPTAPATENVPASTGGANAGSCSIDSKGVCGTEKPSKDIKENSVAADSVAAVQGTTETSGTGSGTAAITVPLSANKALAGNTSQ